MNEPGANMQNVVNEQRSRWMSALAKAPAADLKRAWRELADKPDYQLLRRPEVGLVMVRGRAGGTGQRFNLGEMTVTRGAVRLADGAVGHAYIAGRDARKAELAAVFDALLQQPDRRRRLEAGLIAPLIRAQEQARLAQSRKAAATKVEFFTLARGED